MQVLLKSASILQRIQRDRVQGKLYRVQPSVGCGIITRSRNGPAGDINLEFLSYGSVLPLTLPDIMPFNVTGSLVHTITHQLQPCICGLKAVLDVQKVLHRELGQAEDLWTHMIRDRAKLCMGCNGTMTVSHSVRTSEA